MENSNIKVIFFGTPQFACSVLQSLIDEKYNVIAVVSQPDRPQGRKHIPAATPTHALAVRYHIPVLQPEKLKLAADEICSLNPDIIVTCAYGQFIPERILKCPVYGCLNIHPSLLPKYRGGAPVHAAILHGDSETGVCLMAMVKKMDAGVIYACQKVTIDPDDTTETLNLKLEKVSVDLLKENLPLYLEGKLVPQEQDEEQVVLAPNISSEMEQVHFASEDIDTLYNHVRALIDWPISYGVIEGKRIKFYAVGKKNTEQTAVPGTVLGFRDGAMEIAADGGILCVKELQMEGKKRMSAAAFENGSGRALIGKVFA